MLRSLFVKIFQQNMSLNQRNLRGVPIDLKLNKTPAQASRDEKKCVLRRLRLKQGQMQEPLGLMVGGGGVLICKYGI